MSGKKGKAGGKKGDNAARPIIIKRIEEVAGGHHGGAWKVAYADFVTAMMAFFLLMWLLNATTEAQRRGLADYFSPISAISQGKSGTGKPFGGKTPFSEGQMVSDLGAVSIMKMAKAPSDAPESDTTPDVTQAARTADAGQGAGAEDSDNPGRGPTGEAMAGSEHSGSEHSGQALAAGTTNTPGGPSMATANQTDTAPTAPTEATPASAQAMAMNQAPDPANPAAQNAASAAAGAQTGGAQGSAQGSGVPRTPEQEQAAFRAAAQQIRESVAKDPELNDIGKQVAIDLTPEGLRIQLLDEDKRSMFQLGSALLNERSRVLLQKVAPALAKLTEDISITGHTDSAPFVGRDRSNWELSAERAMATRRLLADSGLPSERFRSVSGDADRDPLLPADPRNPANRRIAIVVLRRLPLSSHRASEPLTPEGAANAERTLHAPVLDTATPALPALLAPAAPAKPAGVPPLSSGPAPYAPPVPLPQAPATAPATRPAR
jgi:chemotaxis protein MotB